jgi:hypothetical protein
VPNNVAAEIHFDHSIVELVGDQDVAGFVEFGAMSSRSGNKQQDAERRGQEGERPLASRNVETTHGISSSKIQGIDLPAG